MGKLVYREKEQTETTHKTKATNKTNQKPSNKQNCRSSTLCLWRFATFSLFLKCAVASSALLCPHFYQADRSSSEELQPV